MEELGAGYSPWGRKESGTTEPLHFCHRILGNAFGSPKKLENSGRALTPTSQTPHCSLLLPLPQPVCHALRTPTADPFPEQAHESFQ